MMNVSEENVINTSKLVGYESDEEHLKTNEAATDMETFTNDHIKVEDFDPKSNHSVVNERVESLVLKIKDDEGKISWQCKECNKYASTKSNLKKHVEIHLEVSFNCRFCGGVYKTRNTLNKHIYINCRASRDAVGQIGV